jgi:hypothetical protein
VAFLCFASSAAALEQWGLESWNKGLWRMFSPGAQETKVRGLNPKPASITKPGSRTIQQNKWTHLVRFYVCLELWPSNKGKRWWEAVEQSGLPGAGRASGNTYGIEPRSPFPVQCLGWNCPPEDPGGIQNIVAPLLSELSCPLQSCPPPSGDEFTVLASCILWAMGKGTGGSVCVQELSTMVFCFFFFETSHCVFLTVLELAA